MNDRAPITEEEIIARRQVASICDAILTGRLSYLEGSVQISSLSHRVGIEDHDPDFMAFVAIDSETDNLPLPAQQPLWSKSALEKLRPELDRAEVWAKSVGHSACQKLLQRFGSS